MLFNSDANGVELVKTVVPTSSVLSLTLEYNSRCFDNYYLSSNALLRTRLKLKHNGT